MLPKLLQRVTEVGIALVAAAVLLVVVAMAVAGEGFEVPVQFTPDQDTYELNSADWGRGVITSASGMVEFEGGGPALVTSAVTAIVIYAVPGLTMLVLLRRIFQTMVAGSPFVPANVPRIRWIGILVILVGVLAQVLRWTVNWLVESSVSASGLHLEISIEPDLAIVFLGLVIVALAEVFAHGSRLQAESDLTV